MRLFTDQDVYATTVRFLAGLGHDVVRASELGLATAKDSDLLRTAQGQGRILVTRDRDYGGLVFMNDLGAGVIYLRFLPEKQNELHIELERVLGIYSESELGSAFVVVEPGRHRIRRFPSKIA